VISNRGNITLGDFQDAFSQMIRSDSDEVWYYSLYNMVQSYVGMGVFAGHTFDTFLKVNSGVFTLAGFLISTVIAFLLSISSMAFSIFLYFTLV
jgi:hypothetical protein